MLSQEIAWLLGEKYCGQKTAGFLADVERLKAGEPLAYLISSIPFLNTSINLDSKPLIPRPETEYWTKQVIEEIKNRPVTPLRILDVCAGSGCIGVAILQEVPHVLLDFIELEEKHLPTIEKNCRANSVGKGRYRIFAGNLFKTASNEALPKYDYVLSNPPYIDPALDRTEASVKLYEPETALYGGISGLEVLTRLIKEAPLYLKLNGQLWLEHEPEQVRSIRELAEPTFTVTTHYDQYRIERFSKLVLQ